MVGCLLSLDNRRKWATLKRNAARVISESQRRITQMGFIGLTSEWRRSVCLFHQQFGGVPHRREYVNIRPGRGDRKGRGRNHTQRVHGTRGVDSRLTRGGGVYFDDPYDEPIYAAAEREFTREFTFPATDCHNPKHGASRVIIRSALLEAPCPGEKSP